MADIQWTGNRLLAWSHGPVIILHDHVSRAIGKLLSNGLDVPEDTI